MTPRQSFEQLENLRRSVAMLSAGQPALKREVALRLLEELQAVGRELTRLEGGLRDLLAGERRG